MSADDFAALEHATPIVQVADGVATTTSMRIANGTQVQHKNLRELIEDNLPDFEEFGRVRFETAKPPEGTNGGRPVKYAILNEEHATLLLTYMRNNDIVRDFKKRLVREFYAMRKALATPLQGNELLAAAVLESQKVIEARDARIYQLEAKVTTDAPKVSYVDTYVTDADLLSFSNVASSNNITEKALRELLIRKDWIYCQSDSRWSERKQQKVTRNRYSEKADKKRYFRRVENHEAPRFRGSEVMHTLKVTPQGAEAIARLVAKEAAA